MNAKKTFSGSRRSLLKAAVACNGTFLLGAFASGCGQRATQSCSDLSTASDAENSLRASLNYAERSPNQSQSCANCEFFKTSTSACGQCTLLNGAVNPLGHCSSWSGTSA